MRAIKIGMIEAASGLTEAVAFRTVFERGDEISVEMYVPIGTDRQGPHDRDELSIVAAGSGNFRRAAEVTTFQAAGDVTGNSGTDGNGKTSIAASIRQTPRRSGSAHAPFSRGNVRRWHLKRR